VRSCRPQRSHFKQRAFQAGARDLPGGFTAG